LCIITIFNKLNKTIDVTFDMTKIRHFFEHSMSLLGTRSRIISSPKGSQSLGLVWKLMKHSPALNTISYIYFIYILFDQIRPIFNKNVNIECFIFLNICGWGGYTKPKITHVSGHVSGHHIYILFIFYLIKFDQFSIKM
jgi:hypothetical protein